MTDDGLRWIFLVVLTLSLCVQTSNVILMSEEKERKKIIKKKTGFPAFILLVEK